MAYLLRFRYFKINSYASHAVNFGQSSIFTAHHQAGLDERIVVRESGLNLWRHGPEDEHRREVQIPHHRPPQTSMIFVLGKASRD